MITVGQPRTITPPWAVMSPIRAAGKPPIITRGEPMAIVSGGPAQVHMSLTLAAGSPPISTVGAPGGRIGPPTCGTTPVTMGQVCMSLTRAAGGIATILPRGARGGQLLDSRAMSEGAVLLVDDDAPIRRMLERTLAAEGYDVAAVADGGSALAHVERSLPDVIVLDVAMPGLDGLAVTRRLRAKGLPVPILLLTARDAIDERVAGLDAGADDYLVKPFVVAELTARIRALLRRNKPPGEQLAFADLALDAETGVARRGGRSIDLTRREAELLALLLRNARRVVTRELALEDVWGGEGEVGANVVDRYVAYLRRKLGEPPLIHTVRGVGFRLDGS
jgi:two-component system, OmpR family, response regulator MprA